MNKLLHNFTPPAGFAVEDYYGVFIMRRKRDRVWVIKLAYEYNARSSNSKLSNGLDITDINLLHTVHAELEKYSVDKSEKAISSMDELMTAPVNIEDTVEGNEDNEEWE